MEYLIIDITDRQVTAARFEISGRTSSLIGAATFLLDGENDLPAVAGKIAQGINGSPRVIACISPAFFAQRLVELPLTDLRKVREILPAHLQGEIALPAEEAVFDALPAAGGAYLALWSRRSQIAHVISVFRDAGCEPQVVSSAPFAWSSLPGLPDDCAVCDGSALAVFSGGRPAFVRALDSADPHKQILATLSALELAGPSLPQQLIVFGEQTESLAGAGSLPLEVKPLRMPDDLVLQFRNEDTFQQLVSVYAVARACQTGSLPDFRRGDLAWTAGDARLRKKMFLTIVLAAMAVVLLFVYKGLQYREARTDINSLNASISLMYREIFPSRPKAVDELSEIRGEIRKLTGSGDSSSVLDVLKLVSEAKGTTINGLFEAELEGRTLRVKGDARSAQAVNEFKSALSGRMATIDVGEIKGRPDGTVTFTLTGTLKEGAK